MSEFGKKELIIRNYPKVIFLWPLALTSLVLWITQWAMLKDPNVTDPNPMVANIWMWMFFANLFVMAFDSGSGKFFIVLVAVVGLMFVMIVYVLPLLPEFNIKLLPVFYGFMFVILTIIIGLGVLEARFDFWKFEKNEIIHRKGVFSAMKRYPSAELRYTKEIPDIFEFLILRAGSLVLYLPGSEPVFLPTVLNINTVSNELDELLSQFRVKVVN